MEETLDAFPVILDPKVTITFEAGGRIYHVERTGALSVIRDRYLERFTIWAALARNGEAFRKEVRKAYDVLNSGKVADTSVILDNILRGSVDADSKSHPVLYICTLFINRNGEDRAEFSMELAEDKIRDWGRINRDFFFTSAVDWLNAIGENLNEAMQTFSAIPLTDLSLNSQSP